MVTAASSEMFMGSMRRRSIIGGIRYYIQLGDSIGMAIISLHGLRLKMSQTRLSPCRPSAPRKSGSSESMVPDTVPA